MEKRENVQRCMTTDSQTAFKITICIKAGICINKGNLAFNIMYGCV